MRKGGLPLGLNWQPSALYADALPSELGSPSSRQGHGSHLRRHPSSFRLLQPLGLLGRHEVVGCHPSLGPLKLSIHLTYPLNYTVHPDILAIIKFGDLRKIRL